MDSTTGFGIPRNSRAKDTAAAPGSWNWRFPSNGKMAVAGRTGTGTVVGPGVVVGGGPVVVVVVGAGEVTATCTSPPSSITETSRDDHHGGRGQTERSEAGAAAQPAAAERFGPLLDIVPVGGGRHRRRVLAHGPLEAVFVAHAEASNVFSSTARPRWVWVFTDPAEMPSISAISASGRPR